MIKQNQRFFNLILILIDSLVIILALILSWFIRFETNIFWLVGGHLSFLDYFALSTIIIPLYLIFYYFFGLYRPFRNHSSIISESIQILKVNILVFIILIAILFIADRPNYSRLMLTFFALFGIIFSIVERLVFRNTLKFIRSKNRNLKHILIVGDGELAISFAEKINNKKFLGYSISGFLTVQEEIGKKPVYTENINIIGSINDLEDKISKNAYDRVIIAIPLECYYKINELVDICENHGVKAEIIPDYYKYFPAKPSIDMIDDLPIINIRYVPLDDAFNGFLKKTSDIFFSILAIVITSPIMVVTGILIKITSQGSIIFKQERIGHHGKPFMMYKFRSMKIQDEKSENSNWTTEDDPRKTKIGSFIRKTSIDELPQFFNVLKGDMSIVGPRPERPYFVDKFKGHIPKYMVKHQVRPGLTGWAQIHGCRGNTSIEKRIKYDIDYVENWYFGLDILIMIKTIIKGNKNAY